jgi:hypothetical protein
MEAEGTGVLGGGIAIVRAEDADPKDAPQARQKRLRSGTSAEHERQRAIEIHSSIARDKITALRVKSCA